MPATPFCAVSQCAVRRKLKQSREQFRHLVARSRRDGVTDLLANGVEVRPHILCGERCVEVAQCPADEEARHLPTSTENISPDTGQSACARNATTGATSAGSSFSANGFMSSSVAAYASSPASSATLSSDLASMRVAAIGATMFTLMSRPAASAVSARVRPINPVFAAP